MAEGRGSNPGVESVAVGRIVAAAVVVGVVVAAGIGIGFAVSAGPAGIAFPPYPQSSLPGRPCSIQRKD